MAYSITSELLYKGESIPGLSLNPEAIPLFETTAFTWKTLSEAKEAYSKISSAQDFTYIRTCNPNRQALAEVISYLENGEKSLICSSRHGCYHQHSADLSEAWRPRCLWFLLLW